MHGLTMKCVEVYFCGQHFAFVHIYYVIRCVVVVVLGGGYSFKIVV